jgi:predicted nucleotide-binding protein
VRVFVGSSSASVDSGDLNLVIQEIERAGMTPEPWIDPYTIEVGTGLWNALLDKTREVDAAAFVFGEDDQVLSNGKEVPIIRDNVLLELGLFSGALFERTRRILGVGRPNCAIFLRGQPKMPADLLGIVFIPLDAGRDAVQGRVSAWRDTLRSQVRHRFVLSDAQITEIVRAMHKSGLPPPVIVKAMAGMDVLEIEVEKVLFDK